MWRGKERGILLKDFLQLSHFPYKLGKWCNASICFPCTGPGWGLEGEAFQSLQGRHGRPHVPPTLIWCPWAVACHEGRVGHTVILPHVIREGGGMSTKKKQEKHLGRGGCHESGGGLHSPAIGSLDSSFEQTQTHDPAPCRAAKRKEEMCFFGGCLHLSLPQYGFRLPWWPRGKQFTCQWSRHMFNFWIRKNSWRRAWHPLQYSCLENPVDRGAWQATPSLGN